MSGRAKTAGWRSQRGQSSLEWLGLVMLVSALAGGLAVAGAAGPFAGLAHSVSKKLLCAASLSGTCAGGGSLDHAYGGELAGMVRKRAPELLYGRDLLGLPVDYRTCRSAWCAEASGAGTVTESLAGEPVTLFTRVIDCRDGAGRPAPAKAFADQPAERCAGEHRGSVYIQYWAYYPESASLRGAPVLEREGYHRHDWESVQVRVAADGRVSQRASSHAGYNHMRSVVNWGSDLGWGFLRGAAERLGLRGRGGWGGSTGRLLIAGGSHAGNVDGPTGEDDYPSHTPADRVRLVPLETARSGPLARPARFDPITPPWRKAVWTEPEAEGTG